MKYIIAIFSLLLIGCSAGPKVISEYMSPGFAITNIKQSKVKLYINTQLEVLEFKKAFEREYQSRTLFDNMFTAYLTYELNKYATVSSGDTNEMNTVFFEQSSSEERMVKLKEIFGKATENYFLGITKVIIANKITYYGGPVTPTSGGGGEEECLVTIKAEVWSVKEQKKLNAFTCTGSATVHFWGYGTALRDAVNDAATTLGAYINNNKME
jgi:hypothetical protein